MRTNRPFLVGRLAPGVPGGPWFTCLLLAVSIGAAQGCNPSPVRPTVRRAEPPNGPVVLPAIDGLVREVDGGPVAGASIRVSSPVENELLVSDVAGRFTVPAREGVQGWPRTLRASLGAWGDRYFSGDPVLVFGGDAGPVNVVLRLQRVLQLAESAPVAAALTDDALSFSQSTVFECGRCLAVVVSRSALSAAPAFELVVRQDQPAALRLLLVGTADNEDVVLAGHAGDDRSTSVSLRIARTLLESSQYSPTLYVDKLSGPPSLGLEIGLTPFHDKEES